MLGTNISYCLLENNTVPALYNIKILYQNTFSTISCKMENFENTFSPYCTSEWNNWDASIRKWDSLGKLSARIWFLYDILLRHERVKLLRILIFNLMMLIESGILLKNMLVVIYAKIFYRSFIPTIYEDFKSVFFTYLVHTKMWEFVYMLDLSYWKNESNFDVLSLDNI